MQVKPKQTMAQNKLLLLHLLHRSDMGLSEMQLVRIMGELGFMSYFDLKECLFELEQNEDIYSRKTPQNETYTVTEKGKHMLEVLKEDLRPSFRDEIDVYVRENKSKLELESQLSSEYIKLSEGEYRVVLKVLENDRTVFEVNMIVYSKEEANKMTENWYQNAISIYKNMIIQLN